MTLNNVLNRIKSICLAHKQIRSYHRGFAQDLLTERTTKYPIAFLEDSGGSISLNGHAATFNFRLSVFDLVNVASDTKSNEQDVDSDTVSIVLDILAQMNYPSWQDWRVSSDNQLQLIFSEENGDMYGGCSVEFSVRIAYKQNICAVPSKVFKDTGIENLQRIYDFTYVSAGIEGASLALPKLSGRRILFIKRDDTPLTKVSNLPAANEYTWDGQVIGLGGPVNTDERFLILYSGNI